MEILRSKEEKRILKGKIAGIEDEFYKPKNEIIKGLSKSPRNNGNK